MSNHLVVVVINGHYRASVYDVEDLKRYIECNPKEVNYKLLKVEETPRHKEFETQKVSPKYAAHLQQVKDYVTSLLRAKWPAGSIIKLERNQGLRNGTILWYNAKDGDAIVVYRMPNGLLQWNKIPNVYFTGNYKSITFEKVVKLANKDQVNQLIDILEENVEDIANDMEDFNQNSKRFSRYWGMKSAKGTSERQLNYLKSLKQPTTT